MEDYLCYRKETQCLKTHQSQVVTQWMGIFTVRPRPSQSDPVCGNYDGDGENSHRGFKKKKEKKKKTKSDMTVARSTFYTVCG